jgi:23S rRNA (uracil1939-C5)-methyltransferase
VTALVLRHLEPLSAGDLAKLRAFAADHAGCAMVAAAQGAGHGEAAGRRRPVLAYALPEFGITMPFKPTDFTQVNPHINRVLVSRALGLLDVQRTSA